MINGLALNPVDSNNTIYSGNMADDDFDGLINSREALFSTALTPDQSIDADGDGLADVFEVIYGLIPVGGTIESVNAGIDTDGDTLPDEVEKRLGLDPNDLDGDTDNDGVLDPDEDFDGDGITNYQEITGVRLNDASAPVSSLVVLSNPSLADSDGDGVHDWTEIRDGFEEAVERVASTGLDPREPRALPMVYDADRDSDGITDDWDSLIQGAGWPTLGIHSERDLTGDSDQDGLLVAEEFMLGGSIFSGRSTEIIDDGLSDGVEVSLGLNIRKTDDLTDSDLDGLPDVVEPALGHVVGVQDTDGDGLPDSQADFDRDGVTDGEEIALGTNPKQSDTDGDGLTDLVELYYDIQGTSSSSPVDVFNPTIFDSDGDRLPDFLEQAIDGLDFSGIIENGVVRGYDSDGNGIPDGEDDLDGDGISNYDEAYVTGTLLDSIHSEFDVSSSAAVSRSDNIADNLERLFPYPFDPAIGMVDTDLDQLPDVLEIYSNNFDVEPLDPTLALTLGTACDGSAITTGTDADRDSDCDGLSNLVEIQGNAWVGGRSGGTHPFRADTDGDGLDDGVESAPGWPTSPLDDDRFLDNDGDGISNKDEVDPASQTDLNVDDRQLDNDGDGISNADEILVYGTDVNNADSDGDGVVDGMEVLAGYDPDDSQSVPTNLVNVGVNMGAPASPCPGQFEVDIAGRKFTISSGDPSSTQNISVPGSCHVPVSIKFKPDDITCIIPPGSDCMWLEDGESASFGDGSVYNRSGGCLYSCPPLVDNSECCNFTQTLEISQGSGGSISANCVRQANHSCAPGSGTLCFGGSVPAEVSCPSVVTPCADVNVPFELSITQGGVTKPLDTSTPGCSSLGSDQLVVGVADAAAAVSSTGFGGFQANCKTSVQLSSTGGGASGPLGIDLRVDSNNDGVVAAADDPIEENIPGLLVHTNNDDSDNDGLEDRIDGFDRDAAEANASADDDVAATDVFAPMHVDIDGSDADKIRFNYSASDPSAITVHPVDGTITPPSGHLRLWRKDASSPRDPASILAGGDFIPSGVDIPVCDLPETLYIESIVESASASGLSIEAVLSGGGSTVSDRVVVTSYRTQFVDFTLDAMGQPSMQEIDEPVLSTPAPIIDATYQLANIRVSQVEPEKLIADLTIQATIDDPICDLMPGASGQIQHLTLDVNGDDAYLEDGSLLGQLAVSSSTKVTDVTSTLAPYDFGATLSQTIVGIEIVPGWNTFRLSATNPIGGNGRSEQAFEVSVIQPEFELEIEYYERTDPLVAASSSVPPDPDRVLVTIRNRGANILLSHELQWDETSQSFTAASVLGSPMTITDLPQEWTHGIADGGTAYPVVSWEPLNSATNETFEITEHEQESFPDRPILRGDATSGMVQPDMKHFEPVLTGIAEETALEADAGFFRPFGIEVKGPAYLLTVTGVEFAIQGEDATKVFDLADVNGEMFFSDAGSDVAVAFVYAVDLSFLEELDGVELGTPGLSATEIYVRFSSGLLQGIFFETPKGLWEGTVGLIGGAWSLVVNTHAAASKYVFLLDDPESLRRAFEEDVTAGRETLEAAGRTGVALYEIGLKIAELAAQGDADARAALIALMTGDDDTLEELGNQYGPALQVAVELLSMVWDEFVVMMDEDPEGAGKLVGRITGEVVLTFGTGGLAHGAKAGQIANVANKVAKLKFISPAMANKLRQAGVVLVVTAQGNRANRGAATAEAIEKAYGLRGIALLDKFLEIADDLPAASNRYDQDFDEIVEISMRQLYEDVADGVDVPMSVKELRDWRANRMVGFGEALKGRGYEAHHIAQMEHAITMFKNVGKEVTEAELDNMPGMWLHMGRHGAGKGHRATGAETIHDIINRKIRELGDGPVDNEDYIDAMRDAYEEFGHLDAWEAAERWLRKRLDE